MINVSKRIMILIWLLAFLLIPTTHGMAEEGLTRFPGDITKINSPNGRYLLYNIDSEGDESNHILFLKDVMKNKDEKLYSYKRYVEVLWSPGGNSLIINDHMGSDHTNCMIFLFKRQKNIIDVMEQIKRNMMHNKKIFGNHHVYIEGVKWVSEDRVKLKIHGYGDIDPNGFTLWYEYNIGKNKFLACQG